ncbi:hypothetical protein BGX38DRAFT_379141 [Terfezia claveryi]|nr:hypothetical protein BGX38DRAFT_379141 [Terfezia claveryi]
MLKKLVVEAQGKNNGNNEKKNKENEENIIRVVGVGISVDEEVLKVVDKEMMNEQQVEENEVSVRMAKRPVHWVPLVYTCLWIYRSSTHITTGLSPAMLALGRELRMPMDVREEAPIPSSDEEHKELVAKNDNPLARLNADIHVKDMRIAWTGWMQTYM